MKFFDLFNQFKKDSRAFSLNFSDMMKIDAFFYLKTQNQQ